jgi:transposase
MISHEKENKAVVLFSEQGMNIGEIAKEMKIHRETVRRILARRGFQEEVLKGLHRGMIFPFIPHIREALKKDPKLSAANLWRKCRDLGYEGGQDHFRAQIRTLRPKKIAEAFLALHTLPGEQGQVDWGHFGKVKVGNAERKLSAFVMVLSWSRRIYLEFFYDQKLHSFLEGHNKAFQIFGGVPQTLLYDNLKSVVIERDGDIIHFNRDFKDYAEKVGFKPQPVGVRKGNEKGRVERAIRYIRGNFFAGIEFKDIDDLNEQAREWCEKEAMLRRKPDDPSLTISNALSIERKSLMPIPFPLPPAEEIFTARVKKTPYISVDGNTYSVPHLLVMELVTVSLSRDFVKVLVNGSIMAEHRRSYHRDKCIENKDHIEALRQQKALSQPVTRGQELQSLLPSFSDYLTAAIESGKNIGSEIAAISRLVDSYGSKLVNQAIEEVILSGTVHSGLVTLILDRNRFESQVQVPLPVVGLENNPKLQNINVKPHDIASYDALGE